MKQKADICPQRVLAEAIRLLEGADFHDNGKIDDEDVFLNMEQLREVSQRLAAAGIHRI